MIDIIVFSILGTLAIAFSVLVVEHDSLVYGAISLGFLGIVNAALFALIGFTFIALFHLAVYVGAGVIFILFSVTMFRRAPSVEVRAKRIALVIVPLIAISLAAIFWPYWNISVVAQSISYRELSKIFTKDYWFPFLVTAIALVTTLIEGITLARREAR
ncbi:MAG: NADH-quinone oxidoreductase subunit J [Candidatus Hadarchaeaceae archaeon]